MVRMGTDKVDARTLASLLGRWSAGRGPLYLLLAGRMRRLIEEGTLRAGAVLPPDRVLASALAVGRTTVVAAYEELRGEGRIERRQGSGTRVAEAVPLPPAVGGGPENPMFLHLIEPQDGTVVLSCAAPEEPPPEVARAYGEVSLPSAVDLGYHPAGLARLREAVAAKYTAQGVPTAPEQVLVTTGAQQALSLLVEHLVAPGDGALVEAPTYAGALDVLRASGAALMAVPTGSEGLDVARAVRLMAERRPVLAYTVPNHHNPTGSVLPPLAARRLVRAAAQHGVVLVDDAVAADLSLDGAPAPPPLAAYGEAVTVGSLSKVAWGGLRVGWLRAREELVARLARLKSMRDLGGEVGSQLVAARLLEDYEQVRGRRTRALREGHDLLRAELGRLLPEWECPPVAGGQTVWVRLPRGDAASFAQVAIRHGVAVLPGPAIDASGGSRDRLRLPFSPAPDRLTEGLRRLAEAWNAYTAPKGTPRAVSLGAVVV